MIGANQRLIFSGEQAGCEIGWEALYNVDDVHKAIFMKNLLDFSDDFARRAAKSISGTWTMTTQQAQIQALLQQTRESLQGIY